VEINAERIQRARLRGDSARLCAALTTSIIATRNIGDLERAYAYGEEAAALARANADVRMLAKALRGLTATLSSRGDSEHAALLYEELFALPEDAADANDWTISLHDYATTLRQLGRRSEAERLLRRCIARAEAQGNHGVLVHARTTLARLSFDARRIEEAHALLRETLALCRHDINPLTRMYAFEDLASASLRDGQYETLAFLLGYVDRVRERVRHKPAGEHAEHVRKIRNAVRSRIDNTAYDTAYVRGRSAALDEAFAALEALQPGTLTLDEADRFAALSAREREVAQLAARGLTNREVADRLVVSIRTVDAHMATIFRKLGIERREDIIR
jgi:ATP/maltotriose-dependent transcriptional regulator MalT